MATVNASFVTLLDHAKRMDPDGRIATMVELLQKKSPILSDIPFVEGNLPTGHRITTRTALPALTWRKMNEGITPSKSTGSQVDETCGMLEGKSVVDVDLARLNGNEAAFRMSEDAAFLSAFNNELETGLLYHSTLSAPEKFMGIIPRLDVTSGNPASSQIIKADSTASGADQTSIVLVGWSPDTVFGIFPKGMPAGLEHIDMGRQYVDDGSGASKSFLAWVTHWKWKIGLAVRDWRYLVRICNIDVSAFTTANDVVINAMIAATHQLQDLQNCNPVFYVNRTVSTFLHKEARLGTKNSTLSIDNIGGKMITSFMGIPIRMTDALTITESPVV